jgi:DNA-binding response OmpR family regulator
MRILVIEDDPITGGAMKMVLEWEGYQVDCVRNGREAIDFLRRSVEKPDLILHGRQFQDEEKRYKPLAGIPVVIVSAADGPFQPQELLAAIHCRDRTPEASLFA